MNRRSFFKAVTGFVAGICAAFVPKAKADEDLKMVVAPYDGRGKSDDIKLCNTESKIPVTCTTWSSVDGVWICGYDEKGKWHHFFVTAGELTK